MRLSVVGHRHRHGDVAGVVHIDVAIAVQVFDDRHFGLAADALDQALATAWNNHVHILRHGDQEADGFPVGAWHKLHRIGGQVSFDQSLLHQPGQGLVRFDGFRAAAQNAGVATFDGERRGFNRHIRPALVNHAEHPDGHPHLTNTDATGLLLHANDFANHVRHGGQLFAADGNGLNDFGAQDQTINQRRGQAGRFGTFDIDAVCRLQRRLLAAQQRRQAQQRSVFNSCWRPCHQGRCRFCLGTHGLYQGREFAAGGQ